MLFYNKKKPKIEDLKAREILDSRGNPTVEVILKTNFGIFKASCPSGASKGKYEAIEIRNGVKRFFGLGVRKAIKNIEEIIKKRLVGKDPAKQREIDELMIELDGTENKSRLGANSILPVSVAVCKAGARAKNLPIYKYIQELYGKNHFIFPRPAFNIIEGGVHAGTELCFQEFMVCPKEKFFLENLRIGVEIYQKLKEILKKNFGKKATNIGDEGGFVPPLKYPQEAIDLILKAAKSLKYKEKISIFLDVAASQFFKKGKYETNFGSFSGKDLAKFYLKLIKKYQIESIEDPFSEDDVESWQYFKKIAKIQIVGDDLLATNPKRIMMAKEKELCNTALIKLNQIGTVTEAIEAVKLARSLGFKIFVSHRSGETNDDFVADFSVGVLADFVKFGAPARGERVAKYNRLLEIEEEIHEKQKNFIDCH